MPKFSRWLQSVITSWNAYLDSTQPFPPASKVLLGVEQREGKKYLSTFCLPSAKHHEEQRKGIDTWFLPTVTMCQKQHHWSTESINHSFYVLIC